MKVHTQCRTKLRAYLTCLMASFGLAGMAQTAGATMVTEYFNNYGTTIGTLNDGTYGTATDGWSGAWGNQGRVYYMPDTALTFNDPYYSNAGNESDANDGTAGRRQDAFFHNMTRRDLSSPLGGTVWISALMRAADQDKSSALLFINGSLDNALFMALSTEAAPGSSDNTHSLQAASGWYSIGDSSKSTYALSPTKGETYLMLMKIQVDVSGADDFAQMWIFDSDNDASDGIGSLPATEAELPATGFSITGNYAGTGVDHIQFVFYGAGSGMDSIRISNNATGFTDVLGTTAAPEPATLSLLSIGGIALMAKGRRRSNTTCRNDYPRGQF